MKLGEKCFAVVDEAGVVQRDDGPSIHDFEDYAHGASKDISEFDEIETRVVECVLMPSAEVERMREALKRVEWVEFVGETTGNTEEECLFCRGDKPNHSPDCELSKLLTPAPKAM